MNETCQCQNARASAEPESVGEILYEYYGAIVTDMETRAFDYLARRGFPPRTEADYLVHVNFDKVALKAPTTEACDAILCDISLRVTHVKSGGTASVLTSRLALPSGMAYLSPYTQTFKELTEFKATHARLVKAVEREKAGTDARLGQLLLDKARSDTGLYQRTGSSFARIENV